ncbi:MAG: hypothetical protein DPW11_00010 [bacterium]|nr:hypothetical protein [bacterium]RIK51406.1 MAG: hypothetical protein DCC61_02580 [Candidatus Microgenomates bacterium]
MLSTIIAGADLNSRAEYVRTLLTPLTNLVHLTPNPSSIGIAEIKSLVLDLALTSASPRLVWVEDAQALTPDASNALLKILEEPPDNTTLYLTCPSAGSLLPTLRSRCQVIKLNNFNLSPLTSYLPALKPLFVLSPGDRLQRLADFPSDKGELLSYLSDLAREISGTIKKTKSPAGLKLLSSLARLTLSTHQDLKSNINQNLALSHFLLHLPKTK